MFTMWTVGSNPTLSVEYRETGTGTKGVPDLSCPDLAGPGRSTVFFWGSSSVGRAPESQSGGRRFDSALLHSGGRGRQILA